MTQQTRFNVQTITAQGRPLYLMHASGCGMHWTGCADEVFEYDDEAEAQADADQHGGEVFKFQRWSPDRFSHPMAAE